MFRDCRRFIIAVCLWVGAFVFTSSIAQAFEFKVNCGKLSSTPYADMDAASKTKFMNLGRVYYKRCVACHALVPQTHYSRNPMMGPSLFGILNKPAGSDAAYRYRLFKDTKVVWTPETFKLWINDPAAFITGLGGDRPKQGFMVDLHKTTCEEGQAAIVQFLEENLRGPEISLKTARSLTDERIEEIKNNRDFPGAKVAKSSLFLFEAQSEKKVGYLDNALVLVEEALQLKGLSYAQKGRALFLRGSIHAQRGKLVKADEALTRSLKFFKKPSVYALHGDVSFCLSKTNSNGFSNWNTTVETELKSVFGDYDLASQMIDKDEDEIIKKSKEKSLLVSAILKKENRKAVVDAFEKKLYIKCSSSL